MILPVFLSLFFILLFLVKFICTGIVLEHAVDEAAKEIAASSYPISFINEFEDDRLEEYGNAEIPAFAEEPGQHAGQSGGIAPPDILQAVISADFNGEEVTQVLEGVLENYLKGIAGGVIDCVTPAYWEMKAYCKYYIADTLIRGQLDSTLIDPEGLKLRLVELPQGKAEFKARSARGIYERCGLTPVVDFDDEDVVIQLEYDYKVQLPFVKTLAIKTVHTAVERAWIKGSHGIVAVDAEGLALEPEGSIVYITRTGIRYHVGSCRYLRKSKLPVSMEEAEAEGYTPCKVCTP